MIWKLLDKMDGWTTVAMKVPGGWLVRHENDAADDPQNPEDTFVRIATSTMCFVPDPDHSWERWEEGPN